MKTTLPYLTLLAFVGSAFAGDRVVTYGRSYQTEEESRYGKSAVTPGAF